MLHGQIKINDNLIGAWTARRLTHPPVEWNTYTVTVVFRDIHGVVRRESTELQHQYGQGALVLIREIMDWASKVIYPGESPAAEEQKHEDGRGIPESGEGSDH